MLNFRPESFLTWNLHNCPAQKLTRSLHSAPYVQFGISPHNLEAFDGVDDGAKVDIKELTKRYSQNLAVAEIGREESDAPEPKHKQGRGEPNRQSDFDNEFH